MKRRKEGVNKPIEIEKEILKINKFYYDILIELVGIKVG